MRIGLLQCDHVADDLINTHGDYQDMFSNLLQSQDQDIEVAIYDLTADHFPIDLSACDAYIITGSQFSAYDDIDWIHKTKQLIVNLYHAKVPTIGICFGHQLIAEALGGKVAKATDKGWGVGLQKWNIKTKYDWMGDISLDDFSLRASHQDQVVKLPNDSTLYASSDFCPIAGFQIGNHLLAMQGHPEFSKEYANALMVKRLDRIGKNTVKVAQQSLKNDADNHKVGAWIINFIKQANS